MGTEVELKYAAQDAATLERVLESVRSAPPRGVTALGDSRIIRMETRYFDTVDGALSSRQWMLRLRRENERMMACLKSPGQTKDGLVVRGEWECESMDLFSAIPQLVALGAPPSLSELAARGLRELCGAAFHRTELLLRLADCSEAELALDVGELTGGAKRLPIWEMELELVRGGPEETQRLAQVLAEKFGLTPEPRSKFARAKALAE